MSKTMEHITISELQNTFDKLHLPQETRMTVIIEDIDRVKQERKQRALAARKKLKGSGNGRLVAALLEYRKRELNAIFS